MKKREKKQEKRRDKMNKKREDERENEEIEVNNFFRKMLQNPQTRQMN